uniref:Uncharacterized protein n=3 Tax=viral metagenome TaxID=1070528 RepID=A0A6M3KIM5_9ZZZZ
MRKNVASQNIGAQMITAADGSAFTGAVTVYVCGDAGSQAAGSVGSGACTHEGNGYHTYAPAQAETNYNLIAFTFTGSGAIPATVQVFTIQHDPAVVAEITSARMAVLTDWINGGRLDLLLDAIPTTAMRGTDNAALASVCTEARLAELDAANLPTDITNIQGATFNTATDSLEAIRDRGDAAWTTGAGGSDRLLMVDTTIATLATQTSFTLTAGSADDDAYNNCTIVIEDVSTATQKAVGLISDYTGASKTVTLKYDPAIFTMAATDKVYILAENALKSTAANRQLDVTATGAAGIDWANVENPTTAVDLSATDIQLCDTVTTLTGHTAQTADHTAGIADIPTVAEFNARSLPSADYVVTTDTIAGATTVTTLTGHTPQTADHAAGITDIQSRLPAALSGGNIKADMLAISTSTDAADKLEASAETIVTGTAAAGTLSTTEMTTDLTVTVADQFNGTQLIFKEDTTTAALRRQRTSVTGTAVAGGKLTFTAITTAPVDGDSFTLV